MRKRVASALSRSSFKRRRTGSKNTRFRKSASLGKAFPSKLVMTHRYVTNYATQTVTSAGAAINILANGMYDPEPALGGHQPLCFDQMCAIYDQWTVIGSRIKWTVTRNGGDPGAPLFICTYLNDDNTTTSPSVFALAEQNRARVIVDAPGDAAYGNTRAHVLRQKFSAKRMFGKGSLTNSLLQGTATADPSEIATFQLHFLTTTPNTVNVNVLVEVEYIAVWTEAKEIAQS